MPFTMPQKVLFKHCDPAGIVFYPRYFEMINDCVEACFEQKLNAPFEELLKDGGVPTVEISAKFHAPSRHGDALILTLEPVRLGHSSFGITVTATCADEVRFVATSTLVYVNDGGKPARWPAHIRASLENFTGEMP